MSDTTSCPWAEGNTSHPTLTPHHARLGDPRDVPRYPLNLYSPAAIRDAYTHYRALRDLGPIVWSTAHSMYLVPRYAEVRQVLADDATFRSSGAVTVTKLAGWTGASTTLVSDDDRHAVRRKLVATQLTPRALRARRESIQAVASSLVARALDKCDIDGVDDLALAMPLTVVPDLVGWPDYGRDKLLGWGVASFDYAGPANRLFWRSLPSVIAMRLYVDRIVRRRDVEPGSAAEVVVNAFDAGDISRSECASLLIDLLNPSIDTTASIIAAALQLFADHPDQWSMLRDDRSLLTNAVHEVVRLASPLRAFTRRAVTDTVVGDTRIDAGARLLILFASANRDERFWTDPDRFDITRDATPHVGFGYGVHSCAGQGLGRMETAAVLEALLDRVTRIERRGDGERATNNVIYRWEKLPLRLCT